jgi:hypothetical protein
MRKVVRPMMGGVDGSLLFRCTLPLELSDYNLKLLEALLKMDLDSSLHVYLETPSE